jgi:hypothetical protein
VRFAQSQRGRRLFHPLMWVALVGLSLSLSGCGSSGPSKSYEQGWDSSVKSARATNCNAAPEGTESPSDWTKGCNLGQEAINLHRSGRPSAAPTTFPGDP